MSKTKPYGSDRCPNCKEYGAHFVPPSFGEKGFFHCKKAEGCNCRFREKFVDGKFLVCPNCGSRAFIRNA